MFYFLIFNFLLLQDRPLRPEGRQPREIRKREVSSTCADLKFRSLINSYTSTSSKMHSSCDGMTSVEVSAGNGNGETNSAVVRPVHVAIIHFRPIEKMLEAESCRGGMEE